MPETGWAKGAGAMADTDECGRPAGEGFAGSDDVTRRFERCFIMADVSAVVTDGLAVKTRGRGVETLVLWSL